MKDASPPNRYRVEKREHHGGGLFELEVTTHFDVVDNTTGEVMMTFSGEDSASYDGVGWAYRGFGGTSDVVIAPDGEHVLVYESGNAEPREVLITKRSDEPQAD